MYACCVCRGWLVGDFSISYRKYKDSFQFGNLHRRSMPAYTIWMVVLHQYLSSKSICCVRLIAPFLMSFLQNSADGWVENRFPVMWDELIFEENSLFDFRKCLRAKWDVSCTRLSEVRNFISGDRIESLLHFYLHSATWLSMIRRMWFSSCIVIWMRLSADSGIVLLL